MGQSTSVPAPIDYRVEKCIKQFQIPVEKIQKLWVMFLRYDRDKKGLLYAQDVFDQILILPKNGLSQNMFGLIGTKSEGTLDFGEFVELICTFACFEQMELLRYFFYILDPHRVGVVEKKELQHFLLSIWNHQSGGSIHDAINYLDMMDDDGDGSFTFKQVLMLKDKYPNLFFPVYDVQMRIINATFGEYWWSNHKQRMIEEAHEKRDREDAERRKVAKQEEDEQEQATENMLKRRMGITYYLMPWRIPAERLRIARIAAIEDEMDQVRTQTKTLTEERKSHL